MPNQPIRGARNKALIVGISEYDDPGLQNLEFCKNDAEKMYESLKSLILENDGWEVSDNYKLVGQVKGQKLRYKTFDFFHDKTYHPDDILLFYYSGHGVLDDNGNPYLAYSDINPDEPGRGGFSFNDLTNWIEDSIPDTAVIILDCCYSGSAKLRSKGMMTSKADEDNQAKLGRKAIIERLKNLPQRNEKEKRICILSASQAAQEAYALEKDNHSIFTRYLLQGLKGNTNSVDSNGNITPLTLGNYINREIMSLPANERPKQRPITRAEGSENVILASHPELKKMLFSYTKQKQSKYQFLGWNKRQLLIPVIVAAAVIGSILIFVPGSNLGPVNHVNNITSIYNSGFNNGSQTALADMQKGKSFNPSCDPTGAHAKGGQNPVPFCNGWTNGYIKSWNSKHPGWTDGYIKSWKPNNPPPKGTILSCLQCGSKLKPIVRYINGTTDGQTAAQNDIEAGKSFNPACDPTSAHAGDRQHTTFYCNGWTDGYISAWNEKHKPSSTQNVNSGIHTGVPQPASSSNSTASHKRLPTLALICNKSGSSLICTYTNKT